MDAEDSSSSVNTNTNPIMNPFRYQFIDKENAAIENEQIAQVPSSLSHEHTASTSSRSTETSHKYTPHKISVLPKKHVRIIDQTATSAVADPSSRLQQSPSPQAMVPSTFRTPHKKLLSPQQRQEARHNPPGSSKLLRQHFNQKLSFTPHTQRRLIDSGAVRCETPTPHKPHIRSGAIRTDRATPAKSTTKNLYHAKRVGYDGTLQTPSKELMRSTASSRSHQIPHDESPTRTKLETKISLSFTGSTSATPQMCRASSNSFHSNNNTMNETASFDSSLVRANLSMSSCSSSISRADANSPTYLQTDKTPKRSSSYRRDCFNPMALTLLNDGTEDPDILLAQDVSDAVAYIPLEGNSTNEAHDLPSEHNDFVDNNCMDSSSAENGVETSILSTCPSLRKVSSSLSDVMDQNDMATLFKPAPRRSCPNLQLHVENKTDTK